MSGFLPAAPGSLQTGFLPSLFFLSLNDKHIPQAALGWDPEHHGLTKHIDAQVLTVSS